ncbi:MAG: non-canonical purine NTP pyrophosphatase [Pseudomonadota bacterium]
MVSTLTANSVLLLASNSEKKLKEMNKQLEGSGVTVLTLKDLDLPQADETGTTMAENASIKSEAAAAAVDMAAVADIVGRPVDKVVVVSEDTGLEIPSLNNWPGPYFADLTETAGGERDEMKGNQIVLDRMRGKQGDDRAAVFTSTLAVTEVTAAGVQGKPTLFTAGLEGKITTRPEGRNGFGFDPIFAVTDAGYRGKTLAQIDTIGKAELSPRTKALSDMVAALYPLPSAGPDQPGVDAGHEPRFGDAR